MPNSTDNPPSPPAASVWPPPPTSTPETFVVESVTVTKHGELLTVNEPLSSWTAIFGILIPTAVLAVGFGLSVKIWIDFHNEWGPKVALWSDSFFLHHLRDAMLKYLFMGGMFVGLLWWSLIVVQGNGKTMFSRSAKSMQVGRQLYQVQSVFVRRQPVFKRAVFLVSFRTSTVKKFSPPFRYLRHNFRHSENAQHLAEEVSAFLGVPVKE